MLCRNVQAIHVFALRVLHQALFTRVRACVLLLSVFYVLTIITGESVKLLLINSLHSNATRFSYALKCGFKVLLLLVFVISEAITTAELKLLQILHVKHDRKPLSKDATHH